MPGDTAGTGGRLLVIGADHRTAPPAWRDRFAVIEANLAEELDRLRARGLGDLTLLATCDRIELITTDADVARLRQGFTAYLAERLSATQVELAAALYAYEGAAALRHLFSVASSLESLVLGEPHILGQLRAAHRAASDAGLVGGDLEAALQGAFAAARRVRRETRIGERPGSIAAAALDVAREIHGDLDRAVGVLIGTGEMGELMLDQLRLAGLGKMVVSGAVPAVEAIAARLSCPWVALPPTDTLLAEGDILIAAATGGPRMLSAGTMAAALRQRRRRPVFVIDAAIPPTVEPAVNDLDGAFLYTLDDLERAAIAGRSARETAATEARAVLDDELAAFQRRRAERAAVPAVTALRSHFEAVRAALLRDQPGLDAEAATRLLVNRLLHAPSEVLRGLAASVGDASDAEALARRLFRLDRDKGEEDP
ncbi:MAG TPA: glutamyl-tRNA reductase [Stellaceae bacterium]|nr:glutamyl-tRNA reductase [Stellaceae bacterium]